MARNGLRYRLQYGSRNLTMRICPPQNTRRYDIQAVHAALRANRLRRAGMPSLSSSTFAFHGGTSDTSCMDAPLALAKSACRLHTPA
eukprot:409122-Pyramimonas_sp.AAC.1